MRKVIALMFAMSAMSFGGQAIAATINISGKGVLTCSAACEGLYTTPADTYPGETSHGWSSTAADVFTVHPPNDATERNFVNHFTGESFTGANKDETGNAPTGSSAMYVLFKFGGGHSYATALIRNTSGGALTYSWAPISGDGNGLSHTNSFGEVSPVPLPAAGLMLLGGLGALGAMRRRRKS